MTRNSHCSSETTDPLHCMIEFILSYNIRGFPCFWWMKCFIIYFGTMYLCSSVLVLSDKTVVLYHWNCPPEAGGRPGSGWSVPYHYWWSPREIRGKVCFWFLNSNILLTAYMKIYQLHVHVWQIFQLIQTGYHIIFSDFVGIRNWRFLGYSLLFNVWYNACLQDFE